MTVSPLPHRHQWEVRSAHRTSEGRVRYQRCACGEWQVTITPEADVSTPVGVVLAGERHEGGARR